MNVLLFRHSNVKQTKGNRSQLWACLVCMLNAVHISATYNATPRYTQRKKFPRRAFAEQNENLSIGGKPITCHPFVLIPTVMCF